MAASAASLGYVCEWITNRRFDSLTIITHTYTLIPPPPHTHTLDQPTNHHAHDSFPAVAHGMFARGAVELVEYFADRVDAEWVAALESQRGELAALSSARERLKLAIQLRLRLLGTYVASACFMC